MCSQYVYYVYYYFRFVNGVFDVYYVTSMPGFRDIKTVLGHVSSFTVKSGVTERLLW